MAERAEQIERAKQAVGATSDSAAGTAWQVLISQAEELAQHEQATTALGARRTPHAPAKARNIGDQIFVLTTSAFAALIIGTLLLMLGLLAYKAWPSITTFGISFFTSSNWDPLHNTFGAAPSILGSIYSSVLALLFAGPIGILIAIFLAEMAAHRLRLSLGFVIELLAAVPSVVYGLWAVVVLVPLVRQYIETPLTDQLGGFPLFSGYPIGLGMFTAALVLAIMITPTIAAIGRDVMQAVPKSQREAMLALGATRWETTWKVVIPYARSGIIGGIMLALGRAIGETMAVQMVIGNNVQSFGISLFNLGTTMPATLVNQFTEATSPLYLSALFEVALILFLIAVILNILARLLVWGVTRKEHR
jgi:phosphate transport system permease protein